MNVLSRLEAHWVVLEAELVEINKDITYSEQCVQKYGYVQASCPHATGAASNMPVHGVPGPAASTPAFGSISPTHFFSVSAVSVFLSHASPPPPPAQPLPAPPRLCVVRLRAFRCWLWASPSGAIVCCWLPRVVAHARADLCREYFTYPLQHLKDLKRIKKQKMKDIIKAMEAFNENLVGGKRLVKALERDTPIGTMGTSIGEGVAGTGLS